MGKPRSDDEPVLCRLQLLQGSRYAEDNAGRRRWPHRSRLERAGVADQSWRLRGVRVGCAVMSVQKAVMALSEKLAVLAEQCGPTPDPVIVKRRWRFLGIFPTSRIDSELWVAGDGDWWRVMLSNARRLQIIGADFR